MPEVYQEVQEKVPEQNQEEQTRITRLFEYTDDKHNPWRQDFLENTAKECHNFKELRQWNAADAAILASLEVPAVAVDRINRGLDTIDGIRANTGSKKKITKRELGDERAATILDRACEYVAYNGDFDSVKDSAFDSLKTIGMGVRKLGFDPGGDGGGGEVWTEFVDFEDFGYSKCKSKELTDITWAWHHQIMPWEDAMMIAPEKAGEIKGLKTLCIAEWEKIKAGGVGTDGNRDYQNEIGGGQPQFGYPEFVHLWEFWTLKRVPVAKVGYVEIGQQQDPMTGAIVPVPTPKVRYEAIDYQAQEGEAVIAKTVLKEWYQDLIASGGNKRNGILLETAKAEDHPFVGMCAEVKKSGQPVGYIEKTKDHQRRINLAWAQKVAFNNKAIKSPLVTKGQPFDPETSIHQSRIGAMLHIPLGTDVVAINTIPNVNLQSIEEGESARRDMDFAAAATEAPMRGVSNSGDSGLKVSLEQSAAITPLNKWVKAEQKSEIAFWRKALRLIAKNFQPEKLARIVGETEIQKIMLGPIDPATGQPMLPPMQVPLPLDVEQYDVVIEDKALSDFNRQQSFNAVESLAGSGIIFTDTFRIQNAPIRNTDEALASNEKARNDLMRMLMMENQALKEQLGVAQKEAGKGQNQRANATRGKNEPQSGRRSMLGGQNGLPGGSGV